MSQINSAQICLKKKTGPSLFHRWLISEQIKQSFLCGSQQLEVILTLSFPKVTKNLHSLY